MSSKERERLVVMERMDLGQLLLKEAAWEMKVSVRQAIRIRKDFLRDGAAGLVHRSRGMPSHHRAEPEFKRRVLAVYPDRYPGFGPTLAAEKMEEYEGIVIHHETLRRWLIGDNQWQVGTKERVHRSKRTRRACFGELLQIDGSDHKWFGEDGPRTMLMVLVDDATGHLALHMAREETTAAALEILRKWVKAHGVPAALYADRRTVYFTEAFVQEPARRRDSAVFTEFMKVTERLGIEMIPAHSPEAKGRVERANKTLQDRLVKEFGLLGIGTIEAANAMLDGYAAQHNHRFEKLPARQADAHRTAPKGKDQWEYCFCTESQRVVAKDNTVSYNGEQWQILAQAGAPPPGSRIVRRLPLVGQPSWVWGKKRLRTRFLGRAS
jgi:hypothetical protein